MVKKKDQSYAASLEIDYPGVLDRFTTFFRLIWALPIVLIFAVLTAGGEMMRDEAGKYTATSFGGIVIGLFVATALMIVFRERYPKWWFDFNLELNRFSMRITAYLLLLTDQYPSTVEKQTVHLDLKYPDTKRDLNRWLAEHQAPAAVNNIDKIIAFNQKKGKEALAFYGQEYLELASKIDLTKDEAAYQQALQNGRKLAAAALDAYLVDAKADAILLPAYGPAWPIDHVKGDQFNFGTSAAAAVSGYPSVTIPAGMDQQLPLGLSLVGPRWSEAKLLGLASLLEQQLPPRVKPLAKPKL